MKLLRTMLYAFLVAALTLTICCGSSEASSNSSVTRKTIFKLYNKVQLQQTKQQVDAELAVSPEKDSHGDNTYNYVNSKTGYGVGVMFNKSNKAIGKTVIYNSHKEIAPFCKKAVTKKQAEKIKKHMTYKQVVKILGGEGVEICQTVIEFDGGKISIQRRWANKDNSCIDVIFGTDGTVLNAFYFANSY